MQRYLSRPLVAGLGCLLVILCFHSPRWWILAQPMPGAMEWDRALTYLRQCEAPFRVDVEPAVLWRFLPPLLVNALGGSTAVALALPWVGCWALLAFVFNVAVRRGFSPRAAALLTLTAGASAPVLVSTGWLGINDSWVGLALCYLAFGRRKYLLTVCCFLAPFVDERFVFGLPAALAVRGLEQPAGLLPYRFLRQLVLAVLPFLLVRVGGALLGRDNGATAGFLANARVVGRVAFMMGPLGLWLAFRFAYLPAARRFGELWSRETGTAVVLLVAALGPVGVGFFLAADYVRTAGILLPVCVWGLLDERLRDGRAVRWLALASLLVPTAQVTFTKIMPVNSLPVELLRWWF